MPIKIRRKKKTGTGNLNTAKQLEDIERDARGRRMERLPDTGIRANSPPPAHSIDPVDEYVRRRQKERAESPTTAPLRVRTEEELREAQKKRRRRRPSQ